MKKIPSLSLRFVTHIAKQKARQYGAKKVSKEAISFIYTLVSRWANLSIMTTEMKKRITGGDIAAVYLSNSFEEGGKFLTVRNNELVVQG